MAHVDALEAGVSDDVESFVTDWLSEARVPGASVVVVDGTDLVYAEGFGASDLESNAPATPDTGYGVASVTKSFTALAVLQHVENGVRSPLTFEETQDGVDLFFQRWRLKPA